jgi:phenylpyruvate tautomerase PptA (4-oxalocrotonate tautomerase family)
MPYLHVHTNVEVADKAAFLARCSAETAAALGKAESYVMVELSDNRPMMFAASQAPLAFLELKSLGLTSSQTADLSAALCALMRQQLAVSADRIYIEFAAPERAMFGWNGGTF